MRNQVPDNLRAAGLMACAALVFAVEAVLVRLMLARGIPVTTQVLVRALGQVAWMLPYLISAGAGLFRTQRAALHLFRGLCSVLTWAFYYLSFVTLDLATATVLSFTNVMFTTLLARPVLGERVGPARWAGTLAGFLGVAVMLRPGAQVDPWGGRRSGAGGDSVVRNHALHSAVGADRQGGDDPRLALGRHGHGGDAGGVVGVATAERG